MDEQDRIKMVMQTSLQAAVPLWIERVRDWPFEKRKERALWASEMVASKGDVLQYGGKPGEAAIVFNALAEGLACLAFQPGGVTFLGDHWEEYDGKRQGKTRSELFDDDGS